MNLDPQLLEIVVCPHCRAPLSVHDDAHELVCDSDAGCGYAYPVHTDPHGDIPILLVDEARKPGE